MCSLESELESHMGEFHVKMKGEFLVRSRPLCTLARLMSLTGWVSVIKYCSGGGNTSQISAEGFDAS